MTFFSGENRVPSITKAFNLNQVAKITFLFFLKGGGFHSSRQCIATNNLNVMEDSDVS